MKRSKDLFEKPISKLVKTELTELLNRSYYKYMDHHFDQILWMAMYMK
jgi:hypothetical protein